MTVLQSIVLGITQGITEFLPISSSGHLILIPAIFGWELQDLSFDVALHLGTAIAVLLFFWRDWFDMIKAVKNDGINKLRRGSLGFFTIIVVSITVGIAGILLERPVEQLFRSPILVALMLIIVSIF